MKQWIYENPSNLAFFLYAILGTLATLGVTFLTEDVIEQIVAMIFSFLGIGALVVKVQTRDTFTPESAEKLATEDFEDDGVGELVAKFVRRQVKPEKIPHALLALIPLIQELREGTLDLSLLAVQKSVAERVHRVLRSSGFLEKRDFPDSALGGKDGPL